MKTRDGKNAVLGDIVPPAAPKEKDPAWRVVDESLPALIARARLGHKCSSRRAPGPSRVQVVNLIGPIHDAVFCREAEFISKVKAEFARARAALTSYNWRRRTRDEDGPPAEAAARFLTGKTQAWAATLERLDFATIYFLTRELRACWNVLDWHGHVLAAPGRN
jgi:hypothetical protein